MLKTLGEEMERAYKNDLRGSEAAHQEAVLLLYLQRPHLRLEAFRYWWMHHYKAKRLRWQGEHSAVLEDRPQREQAQKRKKRLLARAGIAIDRILMDQVLSTGKLLRASTGAECIREGGWLTRVGKMVKPTQVIGIHLTEAHLHNAAKRAA